MAYSYCKRQKEYQQDLTSDGALYLSQAHTYLLHDMIAFAVLIPFCNLLIVNNQHSSQKEENAQENAYKEKSSVYGMKIRSSLLLVINKKCLTQFFRFQLLHCIRNFIPIIRINVNAHQMVPYKLSIVCLFHDLVLYAVIGNQNIVVGNHGTHYRHAFKVRCSVF